MKILILVFGLLAWIGCSDEIADPQVEMMEADATWSNQLAADGCSWHFSVASDKTFISLVPDEGSIEKIEAAVGKMEGYYSFTDVHIKYSLTGKKKETQCGWGHTAIYDEITVHEISKKP